MHAGCQNELLVLEIFKFILGHLSISLLVGALHVNINVLFVLIQSSRPVLAIPGINNFEPMLQPACECVHVMSKPILLKVYTCGCWRLFQCHLV